LRYFHRPEQLPIIFAIVASPWSGSRLNLAPQIATQANPRFAAARILESACASPPSEGLLSSGPSVYPLDL
jgi:hypothetical protein